MNKTLIYLALALMVITGFAGVILLIAIDKDPTVLVALFGTTIPIVISAAVTFNALNSIKSEQETMKVQQNAVAKSVNGNTTRLLEIAKEAVTSPEDIETLERIAADNAHLESTITGPIQTRREYQDSLDER